MQQAAISFRLPKTSPFHYLLNPFNLLLMFPVLIDLSMPFLTWKGIIPDPLSYLSHASIALIIVLVFLRMMIFDHVPAIVWAIAWLSIVSISVALIRGQSIAGSLWGWWLMFQFPMLALYAYLNPYWPERFPAIFHTFCLYFLSGQLLLQIGQFATGEPVGDHLAGIFGKHGSTGLAVFVSLILCYALGRWLARGDWKTLLFILIITTASSVLAELKLFLVVTVVLSVCTLIIYVIRTGKLLRIIPYIIFVTVMLVAFVGFYNEVVVGEDGTRIEEYIFDSQKLEGYLNLRKQRTFHGNYGYEIGRNYALEIGWQTLTQDTSTMLFGFGIGARSVSSAIGVVGNALAQGNVGLNAGSSLLVLMQEIGMVGLAMLALFFAWTIMTLFRHINRNPASDANQLRYGIILFTLLWPVWLWYGLTWNFRLPMEFYWIILGYVMYEARTHRTIQQQNSTAVVS